MKPARTERFYAITLRLYPPSFRRQFAADMVMDFRDAYRARQARGWWALAGYLVHVYADLAGSVFSQWSRADSIRIAARITAGSLGLWTITLWIASREWPHGVITTASLLQLVGFLSAVAIVTVIATVLYSRRRVVTVSPTLQRFLD